MTKKQIISQLELAGYKIFNFKKLINIYSSTESGRMKHKYLCSLESKNGRYRVYNTDNKYSSKIEVINSQINTYLSNIEYDSEYFYPLYNDGVKEEFYVHDYLYNLGFKSHYNIFTYKPKDIYLGNTTTITLQVIGLSNCGCYDIFNGEELQIILHTGKHSWASIKVKRNFKDIKEGIDSFLKPLLLTESNNLLEISGKLDYKAIDVTFTALSNSLDIIEANMKHKIKTQLQDILNKLN